MTYTNPHTPYDPPGSDRKDRAEADETAEQMFWSRDSTYRGTPEQMRRLRSRAGQVPQSQDALEALRAMNDTLPDD